MSTLKRLVQAVSVGFVFFSCLSLMAINWIPALVISLNASLLFVVGVWSRNAIMIVAPILLTIAMIREDEVMFVLKNLIN